MRSHYTLTRRTKLKNINNIGYKWESGEIGTFIYFFWGKYKAGNTLENYLAASYKAKCTLTRLNDSTLRYSPREIKTHLYIKTWKTKVHTNFIPSSQSNGKPPNHLSIGEWRNKLQYIHKIDYCSNFSNKILNYWHIRSWRNTRSITKIVHAVWFHLHVMPEKANKFTGTAYWRQPKARVYCKETSRDFFWGDNNLYLDCSHDYIGVFSLLCAEHSTTRVFHEKIFWFRSRFVPPTAEDRD